MPTKVRETDYLLINVKSDMIKKDYLIVVKITMMIP